VGCQVRFAEGQGRKALSDMEQKWVVYILRCSDDTLYTGITDDIERRVSAHNAGKGAKYTRGRAPVSVCYREYCVKKSDALRRECEIKSLTREQRIALIKSCSLR